MLQIRLDDFRAGDGARVAPAELRLAVPPEGDDPPRVRQARSVVWTHRHLLTLINIINKNIFHNAD